MSGKNLSTWTNCNDQPLEDHYFGHDVFINLTPHPIILEGVGVIPSDGVLRVSTTKKVVKTIAGIPVVETTFGVLEGYDLPEEDGRGFTHYIVSLPCAQALKGFRYDIYITDSPVRNDEGVIIGCKGLGRV